MINHNIERLHIEKYIIATFLDQNNSFPMDEVELRDAKIPFELFKANRLTKMISKAIYNFQQEAKPIDEDLILCYIQKHSNVNLEEWMAISCVKGGSFDSMNFYIKELQKIDKEENNLRLLGVML